MPKLIPISSKQMKAMGIVQTKNGFLMREHKPVKKEVNDGGKKENPKENRKEEVKKQEYKPREVVIVQKNEKQVERKRMEDRGIY